MISFEEALETVLHHARPLEIEEVSLLDSFGRATAEDLIAPRDLPVFDNAAMDGYAVRATDCNRPSSLLVTGYVPAGGAQTTLSDGCAIKIMTGAPVPIGCDSVVPVEDVDHCGTQIHAHIPVTVGQHIRLRGSDIKRGEVIVHQGTVVREFEINMLASLGMQFIKVRRNARVAILANGNELIELGNPLPPWKIFNSNSLALAAAVRSTGALPLIIRTAKDDEADLRQKILQGLEADVLITVAGASVGDHDLVRKTLVQLGLEQHFWRVGIKPGKAIAFGTKDNNPVFCLPGNPVSAMITFEEFVRPALLKMMGHTKALKPLFAAALQHDIRKTPEKTHFERVKLEIVNGKLLAWSAGPQESGYMKTLLEAEGIAILPEGRSVFHTGDEVNVQLLAGTSGLSEVTTI